MLRSREQEYRLGLAASNDIACVSTEESQNPSRQGHFRCLGEAGVELLLVGTSPELVVNRGSIFADNSRRPQHACATTLRLCR